MSECPGCGMPMDDPNDCGRCEYFNLASGRYHYCGRRDCYCRNLPGLGYMHSEVRQRFITRFRETAQ